MKNFDTESYRSLVAELSACTKRLIVLWMPYGVFMRV